MASTRKQLSKKTRFEVFKRDSFTCQYCGATPPSVVLEIDHIEPVAHGGSDAIDNLIAACFDCNRGKSDIKLTAIPSSVLEKAELLQEKQDQIKAFERLIKSKRKAEERQITQVEDAFKEHFSGFSFSQKFRASVRRFIQQIPLFQVIDTMHLACMRIHDRENAIKYFCGICWKTIKDRSNG